MINYIFASSGVGDCFPLVERFGLLSVSCQYLQPEKLVLTDGFESNKIYLFLCVLRGFASRQRCTIAAVNDREWNRVLAAPGAVCDNGSGDRVRIRCSLIKYHPMLVFGIGSNLC